MKFLGIDPSINKLGWGVIDSANNYIASGTLYTNPAESLSTRLGKLSIKVEEFISLYQPGAIALETTFLKKDIFSVFKISYVRGMIMAIVGKQSLKLYELEPTSIKKIVTGNGKASKEGVKNMLKHILNVPSKIKIATFDEADALAIAYSASCIAQTQIKLNNILK